MCYMIIAVMDFIYDLLILSLLVDAGMVTLANTTHIWTKGVIHRYHMMRERCGNIILTTYYHSRCDLN
jgi:hypothetical protein